MICRYCKNEMELDDCDFQFKGCEDNYWVCEHCHASCLEEVRFFKTHKATWKRSQEW